MKKIYLAVSILFFALTTSKAQTIHFNPSDSLYQMFSTTSTSGNDLNIHGYVVNDSPDTITVKWRVLQIDANTPSAWSLSICDNLQCPAIYEGLVVESGPIAPGDSSDLKFGIGAPVTVSGFTEVHVRIFPSDTPTETIDVIYKTDVDVTTGIKTIDAKSLSLYPNPTSNFIQVKGLENANGLTSIEIYNIIGKKIIESPVSSLSDLKVDVRNFDNGIYLVKLFDNKRELIYTKTFVKN